MKTNGNESAFPEVQQQPQFNNHTYGLNKREYFAIHALQGILASDPKIDLGPATRRAVVAADALIDELNK